MTSKDKGNIALGRCINFATNNLWKVLLPLNDSQDYDLVIDVGELIKVQVKYTSQRERSGNYKVDMRVRGHNNYIKRVVEQPDYYFVTTDNLQDYFIPYSVLQNHNNSFTLNENYEEYLVP